MAMEVDEFPAQEAALDTEVRGPHRRPRGLVHSFVLATENEPRDFHFLFLAKSFPMSMRSCRGLGASGRVWACGRACGRVQGGRGGMCRGLSLSAALPGLHLDMEDTLRFLKVTCQFPSCSYQYTREYLGAPDHIVELLKILPSLPLC